MARRKLVIHLDLQNTSIVTDTGRGVSMSQALNTVLAGMVWGRVDCGGQWTVVSTHPTLHPPQPALTSFYRHTEHLGMPRKQFHSIMQTFTEKGNVGHAFRHYVSEAMECLEWKDVDAGMCLQHDSKSYHYVLPSVFRLLNHLQETERDHTIILRTFSDDAPAVLDVLCKAYTKGEQYQNTAKSKCNVNLSVGKIERVSSGDIHLTIPRSSSTCTRNKQVTISNERLIYKKLSSLTGISAIKDDYSYWRHHGYHFSAGKPLWIDPGDKDTQHILFDDNIRLDEEDSVADPRVLNHDTESSKDSFCPRYLDRYQVLKACLVQVDLLQAIHNEMYFVKHLAACEQLYDELLATDHGNMH